jgi:GT2 family glycosyltransferase
VSRPSITVVMPFAGDASAARAAVATLLALEISPEDELILADNSGSAPDVDGVNVVRAAAERSPAHARNSGAEVARGEWILFLDADCVAPPELLDEYFAAAVAPDVGALAGEVVPAPGASTLAARYATERSFLGQQAHLSHPYLPRAVAANLMVRRAAFEQVGGFLEGVRAAEDTDFSWRLQHAGWRLELRPGATVEHSYRATLGELRRQWRGYAAGRAWLARRYGAFKPEPALRRGFNRGLRRLGGRSGGPRRHSDSASAAGSRRTARLDRGRYLAVDVLLAAEELGGFALSNRPVGATRAFGPAKVVLVAERFPARGDPLADFAGTLEAARIEAATRPESVALELTRSLNIAYREDDGTGARARALAILVARHPLRALRDLLGGRGASRGPLPRVRLAALAPVALRIQRDHGARLHALGGEPARQIAARLAALTGRPFDGGPR